MRHGFPPSSVFKDYVSFCFRLWVPQFRLQRLIQFIQSTNSDELRLRCFLFPVSFFPLSFPFPILVFVQMREINLPFGFFFLGFSAGIKFCKSAGRELGVFWGSKRRRGINGFFQNEIFQPSSKQVDRIVGNFEGAVFLYDLFKCSWKLGARIVEKGWRGEGSLKPDQAVKTCFSSLFSPHSSPFAFPHFSFLFCCLLVALDFFQFWFSTVFFIFFFFFQSGQSCSWSRFNLTKKGFAC